MNIEVMRENLAKLKDQRQKLELGLIAIRDKATVEERDLTEDENKDVEEGFTAAETLDPEIAKLEGEIEKEEGRDARLKSVMTRGQATPAEDAEQRFAKPRDPSKGEKPYRSDKPHQGTGHGSFLRDLLAVKNGDQEARERLMQNQRAVLEHYGYEARDMSTTLTAGGDFLNPIYLPELAVHIMTAGRHTVDALPKYPLPPTGITATLPSFDSGVSVAARADNAAVSETDGVTSTKTHYVNEFSGQVDCGRIEIMRSLPAFDVEITSTLIKRYNVAVNVSALTGSGTPPAHKGFDNLTSPNTVTWTQATPTGVGFLGQVYKGIAAIDATRLEVDPDLIIMHGRRAAWLGQAFSGTSGAPVIQQGSMIQTLGTQDGGFTESIAGLRLVRDNNITTTAGNPGTNQDKVYVLYREDFLFAEGPLYTKVFEDVGSGTGTIRYQVFAHSLFLSDRYPKSLCIISGSGLADPTYNS